ncbi:MAG: TonB-dependent receptor [Bacteroidales bacterium]|nr:TonB-dependent receptor [Bacteroidales bacterium]
MKSRTFTETILGAAILLLSVLSIPLSAQSRKVVLSGYVRDASSGEPLTGAVIFTEDRSVGVVADRVGYYSLSVAGGEVTLLCSFTGYITETKKVNATSSTKVDFALNTDKETLEAATVFSKSKRDELKIPQMGLERVDAALVQKLPALMGETDIIRVIQMMPGVQTPSEGATGFSVRGGGVDQNLILMDGAPLYNCGHFLGFLSMFNSDAVRGAELYKGDFPAQYGGRLSSVLDVNTKDGNYHQFGGNASIGLITSKVFVEGPIIPEKLSFMASARRTYLDIFFPLFGDNLPDGTKMFFYDLNGKLSWIASEKDRFYLSAFSGRDTFGLSMDEFDMGKMEFGFTNNTQSLRWNHVYGPKLTSDVTLYNSLYRNTLGGDISEAQFDYIQGIRESGLRAGWTWYLNPKNTMQAGVNFAYFSLAPGECTPKGETTIVNNVKMPEAYAVQPAFYIQNEQKIGKLTLRYGFRYSTFTNLGGTEQRYFDPVTHELTDVKEFPKGKTIKTYGGLEPRISASLPLTEDLSIKGAYSRTYQYLQQARVSITGSPVDTWFTSSPNTKPQISDQVSLGINSLFADQALELSFEGFYKKNHNAIDFVENSGIVIDNVNREGLLRTGNGWSYGTELMLKYDFTKWSGWLSYTWSRAYYDIPELNGGKVYRSPLNHEHAVNFVLSYDFNRRLSLSGEWVFYSGAPTTYPVGRFSYLGKWTPLYSGRNEDTLPDYHRMDLSLTYRTKGRVQEKRFSGEWNLSLYNAYSRHNAWSIAFNYDRKEKEAQALKVYLFTIIPSLSYNIKF